ncbi:MAG TPA: SMC-Scp complex subunit ScpB [Spirochaetota bacterium]|nr:SMC-Scp complex subunit ScpB [Spirochaetota bacterium]HOS32709.1 SMC-Scp complex subunit ScpB [Spirochaetota bacterium]HOS55849.1 SMC-Scp complex subunit ScpB [Spirochaetota bacterium]HPK63086.1 SMC-Scp complex subunit ScpB [Spirochaetota bacterium]HQF78440.1 SMC-Scp complex subunit ScpB [Spirochaetota bacterium]
MGGDKFTSLIEAILFYETEVVSYEKLMRITNLDKDKILDIVNELNLDYQKALHGITIAEVAGGFAFQIKKDIFPEIRNIYNIRSKSRLSQSALTVLSIIAYKQPVTKGEIEAIRGVSADNQVRNLIEKGLIEIVGRKETFGKPLLYGTTKEFLKHFNLKSIKDLPEINELKSDEYSDDE